MTLAEFRKAVRGFKPEAELVFEFSLDERATAGSEVAGLELAGIIERNVVSASGDGSVRPSIVIHFRRFRDE